MKHSIEDRVERDVLRMHAGKLILAVIASGLMVIGLITVVVTLGNLIMWIWQGR